MTLIVARKFHNKLYLIGDTKLTLQFKKKSHPYFEGCLKQYIITEDLAIAFAGDVDSFESDYQIMCQCQTPAQILAIAEQAKKNKKDYDLIVADLKKLKLYFVKEGKTEESHAGYIGDKQAYEFYQEKFLTPSLTVEKGKASIKALLLPEPLYDDEIYFLMYASFREVIQNKKIESVDGVIVPLCSNNNKFQYLPYADTVTAQLDLTHYIEQPQSLSIGTNQDGGCTFELIISPNKKELLAFYFLQGKFGAVFLSSNNGLHYPKLISDKSIALFALETYRLMGTPLVPSYFCENEWRLEAENFFSAQDYKSAIFLYELIIKRSHSEKYLINYSCCLFNFGLRKTAVSVLQKAKTNNSLRVAIDGKIIEMTRIVKLYYSEFFSKNYYAL